MSYRFPSVDTVRFYIAGPTPECKEPARLRYVPFIRIDEHTGHYGSPLNGPSKCSRSYFDSCAIATPGSGNGALSTREIGMRCNDAFVGLVTFYRLFPVKGDIVEFCRGADIRLIRWLTGDGHWRWAALDKRRQMCQPRGAI